MSAIPRRSLASLAVHVDYGITASASTADVGPQLLRITDIRDNRVDWSSVPYCRARPVEEAAARLQTGDIVVARTGATTGKSYLLRTCPERAVFASYLIRVRPDATVVEPRYLAWYFQTPEYWRQITSTASGTAQPGVNATKLRALSVPLVSVPEQRRIADILDKADTIRRKRKEAIAVSEDLLRSAFLDLFGDPVTNPKGWPVRSVTQLCASKQYGTAAKANSDGHGMPVLRMNNLTYAGDIDTTNIKWVELDERDAAKLDLRDGDVLFNRVNSHELVGKTAAWHGGEGYTFAGYLIRLRLLKNHATGDYVAAAMNTPSIKRELMLMAKPSINMANISGSDLDRLRIPVPPISEQSKYGQLRHRVDSQRCRYYDALRAGDELFASLVSRAFTGQLNAMPSSASA